ncbi:HD domain-containing protein [Candidatus Woesearchaeota archaeon]|jgi:uncharacterized protein|nr:HD domain-containing protein [Candidatus Woesearchaeota archaeon]
MKHIINHPKVEVLIAKTDEFIEKIGYTEHGRRHAKLVSTIAYQILKQLDFPTRDQKLAEIAGYLHDVGNAINRINHAQTGAVIVYDLLNELNFNINDTVDVCGAIGNHHEDEGSPVNFIAAALIIADKSDVHKTRVRNVKDTLIDIHDRVNWAVEKSFVHVKPKEKIIALELTIDKKTSSIMEFLEIFMTRMKMCTKAAEFLECKFEVYINKNKIL